jgi:hypothetical protein
VPPFSPETFARQAELELGNAPPAGGEPQPIRQREAKPIQVPLVRVLRKASPEANGADAALEAECLSAIGSGAAVLVVSLSHAELTGLVLDPTSGFLLSLMDGSTNVDTLLDLCGLPRLVALRSLRRLVVRGVAKARK